MVPRRAALVVAATLVGLVMPAAAQAAPPANDLFAAAQVLTGEAATATGTNVEATKETGEPNHWSPSGNSVWYAWTAPRDGVVTVDTLGSSFDTTLAVYTGATVDGLTQLAANDQHAGNQSLVKVRVTAGTTYRIAVDGYYGRPAP
jgi:hypothetical protein